MATLATFEHVDLPPVFAWQAVAYLRQIWPSLFVGGLTWLSEPYPAELKPYHVLVHQDDVLISYAAVIRLVIEHGGAEYQVDGVGNVLTATPYRRQGHGRRVVERVNERLDSGGADVAGLFCSPDLESFYAPAGWLPCPGGTQIGTALDSVRYPELRMMRFLSARGRRGKRGLLELPMYVEWPW